LDDKKEIVLKEKLEFESAKSLLMVLDKDFKKFIKANLKNLNSIRQARNKSYLEHGTETITEKIANICSTLMSDFNNKFNLDKDSNFILKKNLEYFKSFINFLYNFSS